MIEYKNINDQCFPDSEDSSVVVYRAVNAAPDENMKRIINIMGGVEKLFGSHDVVVIKPNVQWWNHGVPNLQGLKTFVDLIMNRPGGFNGEVIIAENCHRGSKPWISDSSGWAKHFEWNSDLPEINNFNDLSVFLKNNYGDNFSTCHWIDVDSGGRRVHGPEDGTGYVYCDGTSGVPFLTFDNGERGNDFRAVIMSYPVFNTDKGTIVDFKHGIWDSGSYTGQPLRFINFTALNHHSVYCGVTSSVKNYMGISDLSGGPDPDNNGRLSGSYYNFHSFPFNKWAPGPKPGMLGAEIGAFMNSVRKADLNITTAEWVGLASRVKPPVVHTRAVLACSDPVALDYHACKYLLYPNSKLSIHDPDNEVSPLRHYLKECSRESKCVFEERYMVIKSYDCESRTFQDRENLIVKGETKWGFDMKSIMKLLLLRYC